VPGGFNSSVAGVGGGCAGRCCGRSVSGQLAAPGSSARLLSAGTPALAGSYTWETNIFLFPLIGDNIQARTRY
jgi:hypothetical protein